MMQILSQRYGISGVAISKQGGRPENQDDLGWADTPHGFLLVVCDGMGGGPGGKTASWIAKSVVLSEMCNSSLRSSRSEALRAAVAMANDALYERMDQYPSLKGMGSTLVAVLVNERSAIVAHLGDSRCYKLRGERVLFRTDDHSLVGEMVRKKAITEEEARRSPQSNVIMRALGNTSNHVPDVKELAFRKGDRFALCSDGIWGIMPHEQLVGRLTSMQDVSSLVDNLSSEVDRLGFEQGGHHDNHTLAIIEMKFDSKLKDKMDKREKLIVGVLSALLAVSLVFNVFSLSRQSGNNTELANELAERDAQIEQLTAYHKMFNDIKDADSKELITRVEVLEYEKESLQELIEEMVAKVDSLERLLAAGKSKMRDSQTAYTGGSPAYSTGQSARETAQKILNRLAELKSVTGTDMLTTLKKKNACKSKILVLLAELDAKTGRKHSPKINAVARELKAQKSIALLVARTDAGKYISTSSAVKKIDQLASKIEEIKNKCK